SVAQQFASRNQIPYIGPVYTSVAKTCADCSNAWIFSPFHNETNEAHIFFNWFRTVDPSTPSHNVTVAFFGEGDPAAQANNRGSDVRLPVAAQRSLRRKTSGQEREQF